jgi:hypothetical protein
MRSETRCAPTPFIGNNHSAGGLTSSPPVDDIWTTERRLLEKQPPGAPVRSRRRSSRFETNDSVKKFRMDCLLLPSRTIDEDDDTDGDDDDECTSPHVTLRFRPTRLFFENTSSLIQASSSKDPTTVLLVPDETRSWDEDNGDKYDDEDDTALSPRLLRFAGQRQYCMSRYIVLDVAEADESEYIFRSRETTLEDRECAVQDNDDDDHHDFRHFASAPTMGRCPDEDDRV